MLLLSHRPDRSRQHSCRYCPYSSGVQPRGPRSPVRERTKLEFLQPLKLHSHTCHAATHAACSALLHERPKQRPCTLFPSLGNRGSSTPLMGDEPLEPLSAPLKKLLCFLRTLKTKLSQASASHRVSRCVLQAAFFKLQLRLRAAWELTRHLQGCPWLLQRWWFQQSLLPEISGDQQTITEALFSSVLANVWLLVGNCEADLQKSPGWSVKFLTICHLPKEDFSEDICPALVIHPHSPDRSPSMSRRKLKQRG
ncbi:uncharacterized protein LOC116451598 [Corvus moneduloides]|uniref:uncharacterized protein LOC116451598 n=1 Tax=Corvus moneduloides TaxID=1196302 RepID=UPI001362344C|nr:uncharacterized protein LOC116451598 [Corvus moneduloides]